MREPINIPKIAWNIFGTLFLLFLAACFAWNYNARILETPYANSMIATLFHPRTQIFQAEDMECGGNGLKIPNESTESGFARKNTTQQEKFVCGQYKNLLPG